MISANQEKYLWEIYCNLKEEGFTRVSQLAKSLKVSVPSASKMAKKLNEENFIEFQRYGIIILTEKGNAFSQQLIKKHNVLVRLFTIIGVNQEEIEREVKNIGCYVSDEVIKSMEQFLEKNY
ncbi:metal-dependent transcriptional regulator [Lysinibacillus sp. SGAir0095]|uniref:metal-dependent transcriptional regulator n=1 Tax=Lysinibacillus sp. SGAir0095 TaxID=2070463 RepID=UPI0010CCF4CD|nr:metal-dependent transcriptional regulator [Lysinibacillus sp. SGAir0095]QCR33841.1 hypothetical protein C1N55_17615 [Lysinibacillus sp. SGAir0095]